MTLIQSDSELRRDDRSSSERYFLHLVTMAIESASLSHLLHQWKIPLRCTVEIWGLWRSQHVIKWFSDPPCGVVPCIRVETTPIRIEMFHHRIKAITQNELVLICSDPSLKWYSRTQNMCNDNKCFSLAIRLMSDGSDDYATQSGFLPNQLIVTFCRAIHGLQTMKAFSIKLSKNRPHLFFLLWCSGVTRHNSYMCFVYPDSDPADIQPEGSTLKDGGLFYVVFFYRGKKSWLSRDSFFLYLSCFFVLKIASRAGPNCLHPWFKKRTLCTWEKEWVSGLPWVDDLWLYLSN